MKYLTLIRHAKSSWKDFSLPDNARPLNRRGKKDAPRMGKRLKYAKISFDHIYASPAKRAYKTAKLIAREINYPEENITLELSLYGSTSAYLLSYLRQLDDTLNHVAIVAHNPGLTDLVNALSGENIFNVPTCGIVTLKLEVDHWQELGPGCGGISRFDYPKKED